MKAFFNIVLIFIVMVLVASFLTKLIITIKDQREIDSLTKVKLKLEIEIKRKELQLSPH